MNGIEDIPVAYYFLGNDVDVNKSRYTMTTITFSDFNVSSRKWR